MTSPIWELHEQTACLRTAGLSARLASARPCGGMSDVRFQTRLLAGAELLGLDVPSLSEVDAACLPECYVRGRDLIAAYPESPTWPVRVDIIWRATTPTEAPGVLAGVDVIVSVRTALLDSWPELSVRSRLSAAEVLRLTDLPTARFEPCADGAVAVGSGLNDLSCPQIGLEAGGGPCLFVFRVSDTPFSYAEMTHPADFRGSVLTRLAGEPAVVEVRHRLFAERLEKGVILRARVRGVLVDRAEDLRIACASYGAFAAADPPLGA